MTGEPHSTIDPGSTVVVPPPTAVQRLLGVLRSDGRRLLTTGVPHIFGALALTQGISILRRILLARILSVADVGQMSYVMYIADLVAVFADFGICTSVLKYAAEPVGLERQREIYAAGLFWSTLSSVVVGAVYAVAVVLLPLTVEHRVWVFMLMVCGYIPLAAIVKTPLVFMQARKEIKRAARFTMITQIISLIMLVGATYNFGLWGFFVVVTVAPLSNLIILLVATRRDLSWYRPNLALLKKLWNLGFASMLANAAGSANMTIAVVLLRYLSGSDETVGIYAIAVMVMSGLRLLPTALLQTAFPYLSGLLLDPVHMRTRMRELALKQLLIMVALTVLWFLAGSFAIQLVFGARYANAFWPSLVLLLGLVIFSYGAPSGHVLVILERVYVNASVSALQLAVSAALCFVLIPRFHLIGAAAAVSLGELVARVTSLLCVNRVLALRIAAHVPTVSGPTPEHANHAG